MSALKQLIGDLEILHGEILEGEAFVAQNRGFIQADLNETGAMARINNEGIAFGRDSLFQDAHFTPMRELGRYESYEAFQTANPELTEFLSADSPELEGLQAAFKNAHEGIAANSPEAPAHEKVAAFNPGFGSNA